MTEKWLILNLKDGAGLATPARRKEVAGAMRLAGDMSEARRDRVARLASGQAHGPGAAW